MHRFLGLTLLATLTACHDDGTAGTSDTGTTNDSTGTTSDTTGTTSDTTGTDDTSDSTDTGEPPATFAEVQTQVLDNCSGFGPLMACHQSAPFGGMLDLTPGNSYNSLVNAPAAIGGIRVTPGSLEDSVLWRKLTNDLAMDGTEGEPMPKGEAIAWQQLPPDQMDLVSSWILGGALP